jgi:predicted RNA-binding protein with PIN domain
MTEDRWFIVDGYSVIYRDDQLSSTRSSNMPLARQQLIRRIEEIAGSFAERVTIVFDGRGPRVAASEEHGGNPAVQVIFSPGDKTADTVIERLVDEQKNATNIVVVTSDRSERDTVGTRGASTMSSGDFLELCREHAARLARRPNSRRTKGFTLGDLFPD